MTLRWSVVSCVLAGITGFAAGVFGPWPDHGRSTTVTRISPDETLRARLVETSPSWAMDRNFRVDLESLVDGTSKVVFRSPDEGRPPGTERLIWSTDGTKLLLVGRHFFVREDLFLDNGDQLYFLHDVPTGRGWCNADTPSGLPPLTRGLIAGVDFTERIRLKAP